MNRLYPLLVISTLIVWAGLASASSLPRNVSIRQNFVESQLTIQNSLSNRLVVGQDNSDLRENIYEFKSKSPAKAFLFSLLVPGAGQLYVGSKVKAIGFFAADIGLWSGYLVYHKKGKDGEIKYRAFADANYQNLERFWNWWNSLDTTTQQKFSHRLPVDGSGNVIRNREYYENIGKYDQFQLGWNDTPDYGYLPPLPGVEPDSAHGSFDPPGSLRYQYTVLREKANSHFSTAKTFAIVSIGNHLLSAFEAAIGAKKYNRGTGQYSLQFEAREYNGKQTPYLVMSTKF